MSTTLRGIGALAKECPPRGTAAIEFAIAVPMLLILLIGTIEIGFAAYQSMQVQNAVEVGAMYATQHGWSASGIVSSVTTATGANGISASPAPTLFCGCPSVSGIATVDCSTSCPDKTAPGQYVQVNATLSRIVIFPDSEFGIPANITAKSIVRIQ